MTKIYRTKIFLTAFLILFGFACLWLFVDSLRKSNQYEMFASLAAILFVCAGVYASMNQEFVVTDGDISIIIKRPYRKISLNWEEVCRIEHNYTWFSGNSFILFSEKNNKSIFIGGATAKYKELMQEIVRKTSLNAAIDPEIFDVLDLPKPNK